MHGIWPQWAHRLCCLAVPASPLAQPWNMVVGNSLAALIGVTCAMYIPNLTEAFSMAVALAIILNDDHGLIASTEWGSSDYRGIGR